MDGMGYDTLCSPQTKNNGSFHENSNLESLRIWPNGMIFHQPLTGSEPGISRNLSYLLGWGHVTTQLEAIVKIPIN